MAKRTKQFKRRVMANKGLAVSWNTMARVVWITLRGGVSMGFTWQDAMQLADQLLMGAEAVETASEEEADDDFDDELDQRLRDQLNSEVSAAMGMGGGSDYQAAPCPSPPAPLPGVPGRGEIDQSQTGPAAPPGSSVPLGGTARLAEELGSARGTLTDILFRLESAGCSSVPRLGHDFLIRGLCEHPTDPGKILVNGVAISLGHAKEYEIALRLLIDSQRRKAFGRDLQATVSTAEPPAEIPTLRAD